MALQISRKTGWLSLGMLMGLGFRAESADAPMGVGETAQFQLGRSVFATEWAAAGAPGVAGRLFNATSCSACHSEGGHGRGPTGDGLVPLALVIQLQAPTADPNAEASGDPVYGRVFNTAAVGPARIEGTVTVRYTDTSGYYYPFGGRWTLRVPHYHLDGLSHGPLAPTTIIKPRLAPALFGVGLLEAVPEAAINERTAEVAGAASGGGPAWHLRQGELRMGRFGWQENAVSVRDQATIALAREMGLTSTDRPNDDCTPAEINCARHADGSSPDVSEESISSVLAFVRALAVPESPTHPAPGSLGPELFAKIGCGGCHRPQFTVQRPGTDGTVASFVIAPYTDLRLHDLGAGMADENVSGEKVLSRWRTAPLWGLGYRVKAERHPTFLHDGRATSIEEAILWHSGEAVYVKYQFMKLGPRARGALLRWLETL